MHYCRIRTEWVGSHSNTGDGACGHPKARVQGPLPAEGQHPKRSLRVNRQLGRLTAGAGVSGCAKEV